MAHHRDMVKLHVNPVSELMSQLLYILFFALLSVYHCRFDDNVLAIRAFFHSFLHAAGDNQSIIAVYVLQSRYVFLVVIAAEVFHPLQKLAAFGSISDSVYQALTHHAADVFLKVPGKTHAGDGASTVEGDHKFLVVRLAGGSLVELEGHGNIADLIALHIVEAQ